MLVLWLTQSIAKCSELRQIKHTLHHTWLKTAERAQIWFESVTRWQHCSWSFLCPIFDVLKYLQYLDFPSSKSVAI